jgi:hypothetical protein
MLAGRTETWPGSLAIREIGRYVSRKFSQVESPVKVLNHRLPEMSPEIAIGTVEGINACGIASLAQAFFDEMRVEL